MRLSFKAALSAAVIASAICAVPAQAAYFTYIFKFDGVGERNSVDRETGAYKTEALQGATVFFDVDVAEGATEVSGGFPYTYFSAYVAGASLNFSFEPAPFQSSLVAKGGGTACLQGSDGTFPTSSDMLRSGCGDITYELSSRAGYAERFTGALRSVSVAPQTGSPHEYFSIAGYVPEPSTWALMLAGFAMTAYTLRRRPRLSYATIA